MAELQGPTRRTVAALLAGLGFAPSRALAQAGGTIAGPRRITLIVPTAPGGINDLAGRLVARHIGRFLPGAPAVLVEHQPAGGGLALANRFAGTGAARDGSVIAILQRGIAQLAIQGAPGARFDPLKLVWLGSLSDFSTDAYMLVVNAAHPAKTAADLKRAGVSAKLGADAPGSGNMTFALLAKQLLGLNLDIRHGYKGAASMFEAMRKGEIDGQVISLNSIAAAQPELWRSKAVRPLIQFGRATRHPKLTAIPTARELIKDAKALEVMEFAEMPLVMALPFVAPAGIAPERAAELQSAFMAMVRDRAFLEDARKEALDITPVNGAMVRQLVAKMAATPPDIVARYNKIVTT